jgi:hypothetical protein
MSTSEDLTCDVGIADIPVGDIPVGDIPINGDRSNNRNTLCFPPTRVGMNLSRGRFGFYGVSSDLIESLLDGVVFHRDGTFDALIPKVDYTGRENEDVECSECGDSSESRSFWSEGSVSCDESDELMEPGVVVGMVGPLLGGGAAMVEVEEEGEVVNGGNEQEPVLIDNFEPNGWMSASEDGDDDDWVRLTLSQYLMYLAAQAMQTVPGTSKLGQAIIGLVSYYLKDRSEIEWIPELKDILDDLRMNGISVADHYGVVCPEANRSFIQCVMRVVRLAGRIADPGSRLREAVDMKLEAIDRYILEIPFDNVPYHKLELLCFCQEAVDTRLRIPYDVLDKPQSVLKALFYVVYTTDKIVRKVCFGFDLSSLLNHLKFKRVEIASAMDAELLTSRMGICWTTLRDIRIECKVSLFHLEEAVHLTDAGVFGTGVVSLTLKLVLFIESFMDHLKIEGVNVNDVKERLTESLRGAEIMDM